MKGLLLSFAAVLVFMGCSGSVEKKAEYNYIGAAETAKLIKEDASNIVLVDIQEIGDFKEEHLKGAISTYAYPVKKQDELDRLAKLLPNIKADQKVIVICPRGAGGAERASDFLRKNGIKKENLFTLKNGQEGWPRDEISDVIEN